MAKVNWYRVLGEYCDPVTERKAKQTYLYLVNSGVPQDPALNAIRSIYCTKERVPVAQVVEETIKAHTLPVRYNSTIGGVPYPLPPAPQVLDEMVLEDHERLNEV